jgi:hypothetical protein
MPNMDQHFLLPPTPADWRSLAIGLAEFQADQMPRPVRSTFDQLRVTAWDVATNSAFWRTVQLPSLGPGLLPWMVLGLLIGQATSGRLSGGWPSLSNPFFLWPSLWLVGWFGLTLVVDAIRHSRAKGQVFQLADRLGLFY